MSVSIRMNIYRLHVGAKCSAYQANERASILNGMSAVKKVRIVIVIIITIIIGNYFKYETRRSSYAFARPDQSAKVQHDKKSETNTHSSTC